MKLVELATTIRSKNASPFVTTLDLFFEERTKFDQVKNAGILTKETIAKLYQIPEDTVLGIWFVEDCLGIKISFLKPLASDDLAASDLYGAQQNAPLLHLEI